jgi:hypothetical protein
MLTTPQNPGHLTRILLAIALVLMFLTGTASAQNATATLSGSIADPAGARIPKVAVTVTNVGTGFQWKLLTDSEGAFALPLLPPGNYALRAEHAGFAPVAIQDVVLNVSDHQRFSLQMKLGDVKDSLVVEASPFALQTESAEIAGLVSERRIHELPLNGKDFNKLVALAPGAFATPASSNGSPVISGARTTANNYTIDGFAANDERVDGLAPGGGFSALGNAIPNIVSTEAIQEFKIITSSADATFGRGSGGQIDVVTKSGSNALHGSAYEYLRNDALDARDFFNTGPFRNSDGTAKTPPFRQNLYGGTVGGPIRRNKDFFFGSYEGFRQRREITSSLTLPNGDLIGQMRGDLRKIHEAFYLDSGFLPRTGNPPGTFAPLTASQRTAALAAGFPSALFDGSTANGEAGTVLVGSTIQSDYKQNSTLLRTDHRMTDRLNVSARYAFAQNEAVSGVLTDRIREPRRWQSGMGHVVYSISPTQHLEVLAGVQRTSNKTLGATPVADKLQQLGVDPDKGIFLSLDGTGIRFIRLRGTSAIINNQTMPQGSALHSWTRGSMTLRSGMELRRIHLNYRGGGDIPTFGFFGFAGATGILGSSPNQTSATADYALGNLYGTSGGPTSAMRGYRSTQQEYFTQADWRVSPAVTLNLGIRYSYFNPYSEVNGALSNLYAVNSGGNAVANVSPFEYGRASNRFLAVASGRPLYQPDRNNFQPRLGAAWNIGHRGTTVIRAAWGLYTDRVAVLEFSDIVNNPPFATATYAEAVPFRLGAPLPAQPDVVNGTGVDPTLRNPYTHRFNAGVEQRLGKDITVTAAYVGARGRELLRYLAVNGGGSVPLASRPDPRFGNQNLLTNSSSSNYDGLQIFTRRRFSHGMDFTAAYTYSKAFDDISAAYSFSGAGPALVNLGASAASGFQGGGSQFVTRPVNADWGRAAFDVPHSLVVSYLVELPFGHGRRFFASAGRAVDTVIGGWQLAGIAVARSGQPFNVTLGTDVNDDGATDDRPMKLSGNLADLYATGPVPKTQYLVTRAAGQQILGTPTNVTDPFAPIARNAFRAPSVRSFDLAAIKQFRLTERVALGLEVNAFNVFNNVNLAAPVSTLSDARFGQITSTLAGSHGSSANPRQLQVGLRVRF